MSDGIDCVARFVKGEAMDIHRHFFLREHFVAGEVEEREEAVLVATAGGEQPVALGMKAEVFDQALEFVARELVCTLAVLPVKHFDKGFAVEVVDVGDLAASTDGQASSVGREGQ